MNRVEISVFYFEKNKKKDHDKIDNLSHYLRPLFSISKFSEMRKIGEKSTRLYKLRQ